MGGIVAFRRMAGRQSRTRVSIAGFSVEQAGYMDMKIENISACIFNLEINKFLYILMTYLNKLIYFLFYLFFIIYWIENIL